MLQNKGLKDLKVLKDKKIVIVVKKANTQKAQIVIDQETGLIICTNFCNGKKHDFKLFKESRVTTHPGIEILADTAYKAKSYPNITTPHKKLKRKNKDNPKPKLTKLSKEQKQENKALSSKRTKVENVIGDLKLFKIHSERYRSRGKRFGLRFNLTSGLTNYQRILKGN